MAKIVVVGATGYIGSHLIPAVRARGDSIRAVARHAEVLEGRGWDDVELVAADVLDAATLDPALDGSDQGRGRSVRS